MMGQVLGVSEENLLAGMESLLSLVKYLFPI